MRYKAYLDNSSIRHNSEQIFYDRYDLRKNCHSKIEYIDGKPVAAIRACVFDPKQTDNDIPVMEIFSKEIKSFANENDILVETNKFVIHPMHQAKTIRLKFKLFSFIYDLALKKKASFIISAVREEHIRFYQSMNFHPVSSAKKYPGLNFKTTLLMNNLHSSQETLNNLPRKIRQNFNIQPLAA